jgi:hypothetical protein
MKKLAMVGCLALAIACTTRPVSALTITVGGGLGDWGISSAGGLISGDSVGKAKTGTVNGISYWEEIGATNSWGYVEPGYGGYNYDIAGVYVTADTGNIYIAAIVGMPVAGFVGGFWNGTSWSNEINLLGDIALSFDGVPGYEYALLTHPSGSNPSGTVVSSPSWSTPTDYSKSQPARASGGTNSGLGGAFAYAVTPFAFPDSSTTNYNGKNSNYYYVEASLAKPFSFNGTIDLSLTQTCGNDVATSTFSVPEPPTILVALGNALLGFVWLTRRRKPL